MSRVQTKVMVGKDGIPKVQVQVGDLIKVYSLAEWEKERPKLLKKLSNDEGETAEQPAPKKRGKKVAKVEDDEDKDVAGVVEDTDDE